MCLEIFLQCRSNIKKTLKVYRILQGKTVWGNRYNGTMQAKTVFLRVVSKGHYILCSYGGDNFANLMSTHNDVMLSST